MLRCPKCHRFGIDKGQFPTRCLWRGCNYLPKNLEDIEKAKHPRKYTSWINKG